MIGFEFEGGYFSGDTQRPNLTGWPCDPQGKAGMVSKKA